MKSGLFMGKSLEEKQTQSAAPKMHQFFSNSLLFYVYKAFEYSQNASHAELERTY